MRKFDIVLVVGYFRSVTAYISIIRYLSSNYTVGVIFSNSNPEFRENTLRGHEKYVKLCIQYGAEILDLDKNIKSRLTLIHQFPYPDDLAASINEKISSDKIIGFMTLAMAGIEKYDNFIKQFNIEKIYVPSKRFMEFLLTKRKATYRYDNIAVTEVGLPFDKYPLFPDVSMDWVIAAPTYFSFSTEKDKHTFLDGVIKLLAEIPEDDIVVYKSHNGHSKDYFTPRIYYMLGQIIKFIPYGELLFFKFADLMPDRFARLTDKIKTSVLHLNVLKRAILFKSITEYSDISLEAFLPNVHKGVIGGLSNTIWGSLYFKLPFYNCVNQSLRKKNSKLQNKSSENLLDLNLQYFGVPYCHGEISKGSYGENIIYEEERKGDLIESTLNELHDKK